MRDKPKGYSKVLHQIPQKVFILTAGWRSWKSKSFKERVTTHQIRMDPNGLVMSKPSSGYEDLRTL